jgi:hypothetical protein
MIELILNNKEWLFSGLGIVILSIFFKVFFNKDNNKQIQKSGKKSTNYQSGKDINIGK